MATEDTKPTPTTPPSAYDAMASAFDELTAPEPDQKPEGESTSQVEGEGAADKGAPPADAAAAPPAGTTPAEGDTPPVESAATPAADTPAADTPPAAPAATPPAGEDWEERFKELEAKVTQPAPETKPPVETPPADIYAPEEKDFLTTYEKDWPDIVKGEALRRRAEYQELVAHIFKEVARVYDPLVLRGAQAADSVAETATLAAITAAHPDYDGVMYDDVLKWAGTLTGTRKRVVEAVIAEGEPQELVELITDFKSATGRSKPKVVAADGVQTPPAARVTELSAKAKQAAKALGVVDSKRTAPVTGQPDPDDFDSAWDDAVGSK